MNALPDATSIYRSLTAPPTVRQPPRVIVAADVDPELKETDP